MSKLRVYELAKELKIDTNELVEKLKSAGFSINNDMSSLVSEDVARAREYMSGVTDEVFEEKRVKPTVIRRRKKVVPKVQEEVKKEEAAESVVEEKKEQEPEQEMSKSVEEKKEVPEEGKKKEEEESKEIPLPEAPVKRPEPRGKEKKKERPKPKDVPARIIKKAPVQPAEQEPPQPSATTESFEQITTSEEKPKKKDEKKKAETRKEREEKKTPKPEYHRRKKEIIEREALYGKQGYEFAGRVKTKKKEKLDRKKVKHTQITVPKAKKRRLKVPEAIRVAELAKSIGVKGTELIKKLMEIDIRVNINQVIDFESASVIAYEFGYELEPASIEEEEIFSEEKDRPEDLEPRPPVVTIMGHVDHGKTSLLDCIRESRIIEKESGGITQHIGAYYVQADKGSVVFLDTPGHEAFTAMRARGAKVTDLIVLVIAADDGVKEQTVEAIDHAKAAGIPIVVAVNKIDKKEADLEKVKRELSHHGLLSEEWGGDTLFSYVSAKKGEGVNTLLEVILLQSEMLELKANNKKKARGRIIEARLDKNRGPIATVLIQEGTLKQGDFFVCGETHGKVRAMLSDTGQKIASAAASMPVEIYGIAEVPGAGDDFIVASDERKAKLIADRRKNRSKMEQVGQQKAVSLENLFDEIKKGEVKELNIIIKSDVQGSLEALSDSLLKLGTGVIKLKIIHSATGAVTESDIMLAAASRAIIICFNVRANSNVRFLAERESVDIRFYDIIYKVIDDVKSAMSGLLEPVFKENIIGNAEVKEVFRVSKIGAVAGCYVTDGKVDRNARVRLLRDGLVVFNGNISSLKRFKDDVKEVASGYECGIGLENYDDIKPGDVLEIYTMEETKAEL